MERLIVMSTFACTCMSQTNNEDYYIGSLMLLKYYYVNEIKVTNKKVCPFSKRGVDLRSD